MMVKVKARCVITKSDGKPIIIDDVSSIVVETTLLGRTFTTFKTIEDIVRDGW